MTRVPIMSVRELTVDLRSENGRMRLVDGVSFELFPGEVLGIVGESGSGKSLTSSAVMGLLAFEKNLSIGGEVIYRGRRLDTLPVAERRALFGDRLSMIFQDPMTSLNPFLTVGRQIAEVIEVHRGVSRKESRRLAIAALEEVGIPDAARRVDDHPHRFSGGQRQRVMIAMALVLSPDVLFADEPTTALDVTTQNEILDLLEKRVREKGASAVFVTHDWGVISKIADRVLCLYGGRVVEIGKKDGVVRSPRHPYTSALLASVPRIDDPIGRRLATIPGRPPAPGEIGDSCAFAPRCAAAIDACRSSRPRLLPVADDHFSACPVAIGLASEGAR
jgi:oligopeptide/dipeptide ABC transporter ATP-binding protein